MVAWMVAWKVALKVAKLETDLVDEPAAWKGI